MLSDQEIHAYQTRTTWQPGDLVEIWDHDDMRAFCAVIITDQSKTFEVPVTSKTKSISYRVLREIQALVNGKIKAVSQWDIFPLNESRPSLPF